LNNLNNNKIDKVYIDTHYKELVFFDKLNFNSIDDLQDHYHLSFIDPIIIEKAVKFFKKNKSDYTSNIIQPTYPAGMSVEVFKFKSLKKAYKSKTDDIEKEHVTPFIYRNPKLFNIRNFKNKKNLGKYRFAVDYTNDLIALRKIYKIINKKLNHKYHLKSLIKIVDSNPSIKKINCKKKTILRY
jgi:spore coat polysaccharide biosynthesis protein SpsF